MNFPKPSPGKINCVSCHTFDTPGCQECCRCSANCGCICKECLNCTLRKVGTVTVRHHPKYFCKNCRRCKRRSINPGLLKHQCVCRSRPNAKTPIEVVTGGTEFNTLSRPLGLELEYSYIGTSTSNLQLPNYLRYEWTHDGSITPGGQEMVLQPLAGDNFLRGMAALAEKLNFYEFAADSSCGFHVHVGADEWGAHQLRRLLLLYKKFEDVFYNLVTPGRDGWREVHGERKYYCKRLPQGQEWFEHLAKLKTGSDIRRYIVNWLYGDKIQPYHDREGKTYITRPRIKKDGNVHWCEYPPNSEWKAYGFSNVPSIKGHKYEAGRYYGINLHTFFQRGTVEYRHHEGTVDLGKLLYWPLWCGWFTELAASLTDKELSGIRDLNYLLDGHWDRMTGVIEIPVPVKEWVRRTLKERGH